jgi:predicted negative regulator of RcsB-dependent stress response
VSEHILRKDLKRDAVRDTLLDTGRAIATHERTAAWIIGVAAVIALAIFGWKTFADRQTVKAAVLFNDALQVYTSATQPPQPGKLPPGPPEKSYADASEKFRQVALQYPHTRPGQLSHYYAALSLEKLGKNDDARRWLEGMGRTHNSDFAALANFALAELDEQTGKGEDAARLYQQLMDKPSVLAPKPVVMLALADYYSKTKPHEAVKLYNEVKTQYPDTPASKQAAQQLEMLTGKS